MKRAKNKTKILVVGIIILIIATICAIYQNNIKNIKKITPELSRAKTYAKVEEGEKTTNCKYVNFDAFFLRDLDGDGYAEGIRGTCKQIGEEDSLYMELSVNGNGRFENGVIKINSDNFYLQTAIPKDSEIKENAIGNNTKKIELNTIANGTQKMIQGSVRSGNYSYNSQIADAIGNNVNNYSKVNSVTITGTHIADDGTRTEIEKTINFNMDWYGETKAFISAPSSRVSYKTYDMEKAINKENKEIKLEFDIETTEEQEKLILKKAYFEGKIPELNGYKPTKVEIDKNFTYDEETRKFVVEQESKVDENGKITNGITRNTVYKITVTYPLEAYETLNTDYIDLKIPVSAYYEGYNNPNKEFTNPYKSEAQTTYTATYKIIPQGTVARFEVAVGDYVSNPYSRYRISKEKPLNIYDGVSLEEKDDKYLVKWTGYTGIDGESTGMIMKETKTGESKEVDQFIKQDGTKESMEDVSKNIGIYFANQNEMLGEDGWIKIYDDTSNELIETFTKENWDNYNTSNPYKYNKPVKHIRIETSKTNKESSLNVYNIKELDDTYITENYTREQFLDLKFIESQVVGYLGERYINKDIEKANYELSIAVASLDISKDMYSTQNTEKNVKITIKTIVNEREGQEKWLNGAFLLKIPQEILATELNSVTINNSNVKIISSEVYEENGENYIKILTKNENPQEYTLTIDANITPDPRSLSINKDIELYATNENCENYYYNGKDIYDVNGNKNVEEQVNKRTKQINLIAPSSLLTNQLAKNYNETGKVVIAPKVALVSKEQKQATIELEISNNYSNTVSGIEILGKIPTEGNTSALNKEDLESNFSVAMKAGGIQIPEELKSIAKVYYSENVNPNKDLTDEENRWKLEVTDWTKIKSYLITLDDYVMEKGQRHTFSYNIEIPDGINYNQISYSHHAVYFYLDTPNGKYKTQTAPTKLGFMIAKQYDMEVTKYQKDTNRVISGAIYKIVEEGKEDGKTAVSDNNGNLLFKNLFAERTYVIKEVKSPEQYALNEDEIKFTTKVDENGNLIPTIISGNLKKETTISSIKDENGGYKIKLQVEDEVKANLKLIKIAQNTNEPLNGVCFEITGKGISKNLKTNTNGEVALNGLYLNEQYTLKETRAIGYYLDNTIKFTIVNKNGTYKVNIDEGRVVENKTEVTDDIPTINLKIDNEKIPTYNMEITKVDEATGNALKGANFVLNSEDLDNQSGYITEDDGKVNIEGLYLYVEGKYITGNYVLQETTSPAGYSNNAEEIKFKVSKNTEDKLQISIENKDSLKTVKDVTVEENTIKLTIQDKPLFKLAKKDSETGSFLPNAKFVIKEVDENGKDIDYAKDVNGNYVGKLDEDGNYIVTTDKTGNIVLPLRDGTYYIIEVTAPEGYVGKYEEYFKVGNSKQEETNPDEGSETTEEEIIEINYIEDLVDLSNNVNNGNDYSGKTVKLMRTLDFNEDSSYKNAADTTKYGDYNEDGTKEDIKTELTKKEGKGFNPIGQYFSHNNENNKAFSGIFNGENNEIKNIYINNPMFDNQNYSYTALFPYIENATIENLGIDGEIIGTSYTAGIVGYAYNATPGEKNLINNCYNNASISSTKESVAGIVYEMTGISDTNKIINCYNKSSRFSSSKIIAGIAYGIYNQEIQNCYNLGNLNGKEVCGITKYADNSKVLNCYNKADLIGERGAYGIAYSSNGTRDNKGAIGCYNTGNIISTKGYAMGINEYGGGINCYNTGDITSKNSYAVGISRVNDIIENCYNTGNITSESTSSSDYAAGISVYTNAINCYNTGNIRGKGYCYGITGYNAKNCYNTGNVISTGSRAGAICGSNWDNETENNYYLDTITLIGTELINYGTPVSDSYMKSKEFYDQLNVDGVWKRINGSYPRLSITMPINLKDSTELIVENTIKKFRVITDVEEVNNIRGGNITGEDESALETITYNEDSTKEIIMTPQEGYGILKITINGQNISFIPNEDGSYTIPAKYFKNVKEDKNVVVTYTALDQLLKINKVDEQGNKLEGADFEIVPNNDNPSLGNLTANGIPYVTSINKDKKVNGVLTELEGDGFENIDGKYVSTNKTHSATGNSYLKVDLSNKEGNYVVVVNAEVSSEDRGDYGYATIKSSNESVPKYNEEDGRFVYISGTASASDYTSNCLVGGNIYYLYLGYRKDSNTSKGTDTFTVNGIDVYEAEVGLYNFESQNGKYVSNNVEQNNTYAYSYVPVDLTNYSGEYELNVNASISATSSDYGFITITNSTERPDRSVSNNRIIYIYGTNENQDGSMILNGGQKYYIHLGYWNGSAEPGEGIEDKFTINSILLKPIKYNATTNNDGEIRYKVLPGKYKVTETKAPEGYTLDSTPYEVEVGQGKENQVTIVNKAQSQIIVHHYKKGTTEEVAESETIKGDIGKPYTTSPKLDLEKYDLEKDEEENYMLPENATGTYTEGIQEITYYYVEKEIPLTIHYYIEGTMTKVPLENGDLAEDENLSGKEGTTYKTVPKGGVDPKYELVEVPANSNGIYDGQEIIVTYYYKLKKFDITTKVQEHEEISALGEKTTVKGGTILGEGQKPYETVVIEQNTTKDITVTADEGYQIKSLKIETIQEDGSKTEEEILDAKGQKTYELEKFEKMTANKNIIVEFEKRQGVVIVHHYIKDKEGNLTINKVPSKYDGAVVEDEVKIGSVGDIYATKPSENLSAGYEVCVLPTNSSGNIREGIIEVTYYYQIKDFEYSVEYYYSGEKDESKTENKTATYKDIIEDYKDKVIDGYKLEKVENLPLTISEKAENNVIKVYYVKKDAKAIVHHYIEGTKDKVPLKDGKVAEDVVLDGKVGEQYISNQAQDVQDKYELVEIPENSTGKYTEEPIEITYYYRIKNTSVLVHHYIEGTTTKLSDDVLITGKVDSNYKTEVAKDISNKYKLVKTPENSTGIMTLDQIVVTYYYKLKDDCVVNVTYLEKGTDKEIASKETLIGIVDEKYETTKKDISNYEFVESTDNTNGVYTVDPIEVKYYYLQKTKVIVEHIDKITGDIIEYTDNQTGEVEKAKEEKEGLEGDNYETRAKDFKEYVLVEEPENKNGKMTKDEITVKYYYIHISEGVVEKHIDVTTNELLEPSTIYEGNEGDEYNIPSKNFEEYDLVEEKMPQNSKGKMQREVIEVRYYYIKKSQVITEYVDKATGQKLVDDVIINGHEKDEYETEAKDIEGYSLIAVPENSKGEMGNKTIKVTYEYIRKSAGVKERHYDINTNELLEQETKYEGHVGDEYYTSEKQFKGYDIVEEKLPQNATGVMKLEETIVNYYYARKTSVEVKFVDKTTGNEIPNTKEEIFGHENESYETKQKEIEGYELVKEELPQNAKGTMTKDKVEVIYYYVRKAEVEVRYIDKTTGKELEEKILLEGVENSNYKTEAKDIKYYELINVTTTLGNNIKTEENVTTTEGKMKIAEQDGVDEIYNKTVVIYYYRPLEFNLKLEKEITKITVNEKSSEVSNKKFAKVGIHRKDVNNSNIEVEYKIKVINDGELEGRTTVVEEIPQGFTMDLAKNTEWTIKDGKAMYDTGNIKPGETKEVKVVLTWLQGEDNFGTKANVVNLVNSINEAGFSEKTKDDNQDTATLIIEVSTGENKSATIAVILLVVCTGAVFIVKNKEKQNI